MSLCAYICTAAGRFGQIRILYGFLIVDPESEKLKELCQNLIAVLLKVSMVQLPEYLASVSWH